MTATYMTHDGIHTIAVTNHTQAWITATPDRYLMSVD